MSDDDRGTLWLKRGITAGFVALLAAAVYLGLAPPPGRPPVSIPQHLPPPVVVPAPPGPGIAPPPSPPLGRSAAAPARDPAPSDPPPNSPEARARVEWEAIEVEVTRENEQGMPVFNRELFSQLYSDLRENPAARPMLAEQARTAKHWRVRSLALAILRDAAPPECRGLFEEKLGDENAYVRENAARGLLKLGGPETKAALAAHRSKEQAPNVLKVIDAGLQDR